MSSGFIDIKLLLKKNETFFEKTKNYSAMIFNFFCIFIILLDRYFLSFKSKL